jgi:hypothetical protein
VLILFIALFSALVLLLLLLDRVGMALRAKTLAGPSYRWQPLP